MATLQVRSAEYSVVKQKALEDAKKMQAVVNDNCQKAGQEMPPYNLQELIGKGSFGRVYKAQDLHSKQLVAVKIIDIEESDTLNPKLADTYSEFLKEISALKLLSEGGAKNVNHFLDALPVGQSMWMITEYCAGGSVATLMKPTAPGGLQEKWIIPILREVAEAIYWVHRQGIIHRDIKCANVLVTEAGGVQLCDFGVAGVIETKFDKRSTVIGTPHWMAPELFEQAASYGTEVDIWAFGAMVFEIASGLPPNVVAGVTFSQLGNYLKQHTPRLEGDQYSDQLKDLVAFCLAEDPTHRPPIEQVQHHPYIFGTAEAYPTESLALLVKGYKLWESQGGNRKSLFAAGGAQLPASAEQLHNLSSTALANDEWNFSTTLDFDRSVFDNPDATAVFDVYGSQVDYDERDGTLVGGGSGVSDAAAEKSRNISFGSAAGGVGTDGAAGAGAGGPFSSFQDGGATSRPSKMKGRRRQPPPHLPAVRVPLEKVFDPNTITNYEENSREYYGRLPPPMTATASAATATSDLPLRDDSLHSTLRESLIDLDASQIDFGEPSNKFDMETIRPGPGGAPRISVEYDGGSNGSDANEFNRPPLSDPADLPNNRRTQDWKFPPMPTPASANPEVSRFPFHEAGRSTSRTPSISGRSGGHGGSNNSSLSLGRPPPLVHHHTEPVGVPTYSYDLMAPPSTGASGANNNGPDNRMSVSSLIDLDESLPDPLPERPSTANSDAGSVSGSEMGGMGPFDLEKHASLYQPAMATSGLREPSIYVSDDSDFARLVAGAPPPDPMLRHVPGLHIDHIDDGSHHGINGNGINGFNGINGGDRSQRRAVDSYLNAAGVYSGDDYVEGSYGPEGLGGAMGLGVVGGGLGGGPGGLVGAPNGFVGAPNGFGGAANARGLSVGGGSGPGFTSHLRQSSQASGTSTNASGASGASGGGGGRRLGGGGDRGVGIAYSTDDEGSVVNGALSDNGNDGDNDDDDDDDGDSTAYYKSLPSLPAPPSPHVMQGLGTRDEVRDEMKRLLDSFKQHLSFSNTYVTSLPVRPPGGPVRQETSVEE